MDPIQNQQTPDPVALGGEPQWTPPSADAGDPGGLPPQGRFVDASPEEAPPQPQQDDVRKTLEKLQKDLEDERTARSTLETRLSDTQRYAHQRNSAAEMAQALLQANAEVERARQARAYQEAQFTPPAIDPNDRDAYTSDPDVNWNYVTRAATHAANYGYHQLYNQVQPYLQVAQTNSVLLQPLLALGEEMADRRSRELAKAADIDEEEYTELRPEAMRYIAQAAVSEYNGQRYQDPVKFQAMALSPQVVVAAMQQARLDKGGVAVKKSKTPASLGTGDRQTAPRQTNGAKPDYVKKMEAALGITLDPINPADIQVRGAR